MSETSTPSSRLVDKSKNIPVWCAGCGDFGVLQSLVRALQDLGRTTRDTVIVSGIGCSGRLPYFMNTYGFHSLHGRALPAALGMKMANPKLTVIVVGGDGDGFGIGGGHVPHIARRDVDVTYLILDNGVYALTKGHSSPTTFIGQKTPSAREGEHAQPLDMIGMLLAYRTSFIASGWSGDRPRLTEIIKQGIQHPGFAAIRILAPCPTFNQDMSFDSLRAAIAKVPAEHESGDFAKAMALHYAHEGMLDGVIYQADKNVRPTIEAADRNVRSTGRMMELVGRYV